MQTTRSTKRIVLHIGAEKTGTKSIQEFFHLNRGIFAAEGVVYPKSLGRKNHTRLFLFAANDENDNRNLRIIENLGDNTNFNTFRRDLARKLFNEINCATTVVISNEHLSSRLRSSAEVKKVKNLLKSFGPVEIVVYLRPQEQLIVSSFSTRIKSGEIGAELTIPLSSDAYFNYDTMLSRWEEVFGRDCIKVRLYERRSLVAGDVIEDFLATSGLRSPPFSRRPRRLNKKLGAVSLAILSKLNPLIPRFSGDEFNLDRADLVDALQLFKPDTGIALAPDDLEKIRETFYESNSRVALRYFGREALFAPSLAEHHGRDLSSVDEGDLVEAMAHLWRWKQRQLLRASRECEALTIGSNGAPVWKRRVVRSK